MLFLFGFALFPLAWGQSCYFPDGSVSPEDQPCPMAPGQTEAACCGTQMDGSRAVCLSNNLCMADLKISRGTCTDKSWDAFVCPHYCIGVSALNAGLQIFSCPGTSQWTCLDCAISNFTIEQGLFRFSESQLAALDVPGSTNQNSTTSSTSSSTTSNGTNPSLAENPTTSSSPDNVTCSTAKQTGANTTVVGAAVGVSLGAALLTVAALLLNERRKNIQLRYQLGPGPMRGQNQVPILSSPTSAMDVNKPLPLYVSPYYKPPSGYRNDGNNAPGPIQPSDRFRPMQRSHIFGQGGNNRPSVGLVNELDGSSPSEMASPVDFR